VSSTFASPFAFVVYILVNVGRHVFSGIFLRTRLGRVTRATFADSYSSFRRQETLLKNAFESRVRVRWIRETLIAFF
jgi:hypothetical protein